MSFALRNGLSVHENDGLSDVLEVEVAIFRGENYFCLKKALVSTFFGICEPYLSPGYLPQGRFRWFCVFKKFVGMVVDILYIKDVG